MGIVSHVHVEGTCNLDGIRGRKTNSRRGDFNSHVDRTSLNNLHWYSQEFGTTSGVYLLTLQCVGLAVSCTPCH